MDQRTIDTYNELAKDYDAETADFWIRFPRTILDQFIAHTKGRVLDVGSGPGRDALLLKEAGLSVICLDASEAMVKLSSEKGLESVIGDFTALPFPEASFDGAWAYTSLLHIPRTEMKKCLAEVARILKAGGTLGLGMIEGDQELYRESSGMGKPRWFSFYTKPELEGLLNEAGFQILYFEEFRPNSKNYLNYVAMRR